MKSLLGAGELELVLVVSSLQMSEPPSQVTGFPRVALVEVVERMLVEVLKEGQIV